MKVTHGAKKLYFFLLYVHTFNILVSSLHAIFIFVKFNNIYLSKEEQIASEAYKHKNKTFSLVFSRGSLKFISGDASSRYIITFRKSLASCF